MPADFDALLLGLFEIAAAADWQRWLDMLRADFGGTAAVLVPLAAGADREGADGFPELGAWAAGLRAAPDGAPPVAELLGAGAGAKRGKAAGRASGLGAVLTVGGDRFALVLRRESGAGVFTPADVAEFARVAAFVERTLGLRRTTLATADEAEALRQVLHQSRRGFVLLDAGCRVVFANAVAKELLAAGSVVRLRGSQLVASNHANERPLREAVEEARRNHRAQAVVTLRGADDGVEIVATVRGIAPAPATEFGAVASFTIIRLSRAVPERTEMAPGHLESIFAFTPKEARVASLLVAGLDLSEVATQLSITTGTTRHHLKAIFAKTGVHRQRDLVHLLRIALPAETSALRGN